MPKIFELNFNPDPGNCLGSGFRESITRDLAILIIEFKLAEQA